MNDISKFDEALNHFKKAAKYEDTEKKIFNSEQIEVARVIIQQLEIDLFPIVEMTEIEKQIFLNILNKGKSEMTEPFTEFMVCVASKSENGLLGLTKEKLFKNMSESELMSAWQNPNCIKVVEDDEI